MRKMRTLGLVAIAAGIVFGGTGVAPADEPVTGSSNFVTGLSNLLKSGSGDVKPLPTI
ncbi:hypothetical protein [Nocardia asteroides]